MTAPSAWLNGRLVADATLSITDRGFLLGDGVFETMRTAGPTILWLSDHLARLHEGAASLGIPVEQSDEEISAGLTDLVAAAGVDHGALRLTLSRGPTATRGLPPPAEPTPTLLATVAKLAPSIPSVSLIVAQSTRRNQASPLSRLKSLNYGDNLVARREAIARGADDAILLNTTGHVASATVACLFLRLDGRWVTPPVADGVLPGLARKRLMPMLDSIEASVHESALARVESMILANSLGLSVALSLEKRGLAMENFESLAARLYGGS
jgi:branched-chain amino acid aminotransferase